MSIHWQGAQRIPPGLWAKAGYDDDRDWHILMSENKENIANSKSVGHDHYWKRDGQWYVQIRTTPDHTPSDSKGHLFPPNTLFEICPQENLDHIFRQLMES